ncbi:MAG TPA: hypothetical protein VD766_07105 [Solirubrobacterales bacterium]|nr:hypothetical protein [Solirubrobacterales bacterium]
MMRAASGLRGNLAVLELIAKRNDDSGETIAVPMKALGGEKLYVRPGTSDMYNATWYYLDSLYRPPPGLDGPLDTICEIGSNMGAALTALGVEHPGARLLGVEPDPGNHAVLRRNTARFGERCTVVQCGVWDEEDTLVIDDSSDYGEHGLTTVAPEEGERGQERIRVTTLTEILDEHLPGLEVDYMHFTAEGAEPRAFSVDGWPERVRSLRVELHPYAGYGYRECSEQLSAKGYEVSRHPRLPDNWLYAVRA